MSKYSEKEIIKLSVDLARDKKHKIDERIENSRLQMVSDINEIKSISKMINYSPGTIHNAGTALHNEFAQLTRIFQNKDLLFRASDDEKYDYIEQSFIGNLIEEELLGYFVDAYAAFDNFSTLLTKISTSKLKKFNEIENSNFIKRTFLKLKNGVYENGFDFSVTMEEQKSLDNALKIYNTLCNKIFNYKIDDTIIKYIIGKLVTYEQDGILSPFDEGRYSSYAFVKTKVAPELEMLGYPDLAKKLETVWILLKKQNNFKPNSIDEKSTNKKLQ